MSGNGSPWVTSVTQSWKSTVACGAVPSADLYGLRKLKHTPSTLSVLFLSCFWTVFSPSFPLFPHLHSFSFLSIPCVDSWSFGLRLISEDRLSHPALLPRSCVLCSMFSCCISCLILCFFYPFSFHFRSPLPAPECFPPLWSSARPQMCCTCVPLSPLS